MGPKYFKDGLQMDVRVPDVNIPLPVMEFIPWGRDLAMHAFVKHKDCKFFSNCTTTPINIFLNAKIMFPYLQ